MTRRPRGEAPQFGRELPRFQPAPAQVLRQHVAHRQAQAVEVGRLRATIPGQRQQGAPGRVAATRLRRAFVQDPARAVLGIEGAIWRGFSFAEMATPVAILIATGALCGGLGAWRITRQPS